MTEASMDKVTLQEGESANIINENVEQLRKIFPEAFGEGGVNFETLRQLLGDASALEEGEEKYGLNWRGKKKARQNALTPSTGTLLPCPEKSVDWDTTKNLFIEGDNLEVLKLLQKSYAGKVKMIYIDPPYNTDSDFIYPDRFSEGLETYLRYTNQKSDEGDWLLSNSGREKVGRKHTNWLAMMYPRLKLASMLLRNDGVIFISIDDNEQANLRVICDEIFGGENFINNISVKAKPSAGASGGGEDIKLKKNVEYLLCYCKNKGSFERFNDVYDERSLFSYIKEYKDEGKSWKYTRVLKSLGRRIFHVEVKDGSGEAIKIYRHDDVEIVTISDLAKEENISEEDIYIKYFDKIFRDTNAQSSIRQRVIDATDNEDNFYSIEYVPGSGRNKGSVTTLYYKGRNKDIIAWLSDVATKEGKKLLKKEKVGTLWSDFNWNNVSKEGDIQYPNGKKPIAFVQRMIQLCDSSEKDDLILDFFAGSATVAHAVYEQNRTDGGRRRCISIQLPELISEKDKAQYYSDKEFSHLNTITDLAIERIKRSIVTLKEDENKHLDFGFKVFKLATSNIKAWNPSRIDLEDTLLSHQEHLIEGRREQDILYELLLKRGVDLVVPVQTRKVLGRDIYSIGFGVILACLNDSIARADVEAVAQGIIDWHAELKPTSETHVFFRDSAFSDDIAKTNMAAILEQSGISHVRSL
jgi:adenine-specific DNA-methyltransferase